jgi:hypothetical protein
MQKSRDNGRQSLTRSGLVTEYGLGCQHIEKETQPAHEGNPDQCAIFVQLEAAPLGEQ